MPAGGHTQSVQGPKSVPCRLRHACSIYIHPTFSNAVLKATKCSWCRAPPRGIPRHVQAPSGAPHPRSLEASMPSILMQSPWGSLKAPWTSQGTPPACQQCWPSTPVHISKRFKLEGRVCKGRGLLHINFVSNAGHPCLHVQTTVQIKKGSFNKRKDSFQGTLFSCPIACILRSLTCC